MDPSIMASVGLYELSLVVTRLSSRMMLDTTHTLQGPDRTGREGGAVENIK